jgi:hypothetical protein
MQELSLFSKPTLPHLMIRCPILWRPEEGVPAPHRVGLRVLSLDYNIA